MNLNNTIQSTNHNNANIGQQFVPKQKIKLLIKNPIFKKEDSSDSEKENILKRKPVEDLTEPTKKIKMESNVDIFQNEIQNLEKILIPIAVNSWNKACKRGTWAKDLVVTNEDVYSKFRKVGRVRHSKDDRTTTDVIKFESILPFPGYEESSVLGFTFELYKDVLQGILIATYSTPSKNGCSYTVGDIPD